MTYPANTIINSCKAKVICSTVGGGRGEGKGKVGGGGGGGGGGGEGGREGGEKLGERGRRMSSQLNFMAKV